MTKKNVEQKPFRIARWIMLSFAVLLNSFIIVYSCLDDKTTNNWSRFVSNIFTNVVNAFTHKEQTYVPVDELDAGFTTYTMPGYDLEEIPIGIEKEISANLLPKNATNQAINFITEENDIISLSQNGSKVSALGLKPGIAKIKVTCSNADLSKEITVRVVDLIAPLQFDASINNTTIPIGSPETINVTVINAFEDEIDNFLHYDVSKLTYSSDDDSIATVGSYGVITPINEGSTTIRVFNSVGFQKSFNIIVTSGSPAPAYQNLEIFGESYCYENDVFSNKKVSLTIKNNGDTLDNSDFIWQSSNPLLVKVNQKGEVYGYRKTSLEDETVTIRAISKKTQQEITKEITIRKELPTKLYTCYVIGDKELWDHPKVTTFVGDVITVRVSYDKTVTNYNTSVLVSDESIVNYTNQGTNIVLEFKKEGSVDITITSDLVPSLTNKTEVTVKPAGAINKDNYEDINLTIRKSIGHALMFAITQVFTFLALYMFLPKMKWWQVALISLGAGLLLASVSELIQAFIPLRSGKFIDVLIDMSGVITGLGITIGVLMLVKYLKKKKETKDNKSV